MTMYCNRLLSCLGFVLLVSLVSGTARAADGPLFAGRKPLVPNRVATVSACTNLGERYPPGLFDRTVEQLPSLGFNGVMVMISTVHGTSAGRDLLPQIVGDPEKTKAWSAMFDRIEALGLNIYLSFAPIIPPEFTKEQVKAYYAGQRELDGLPARIRAVTEAQADAVFTALPQVDGLMLHSLELEELWGPNVVSPYPAKDVPAAERALGAYLNGLQAACQKHQKQAWFWTHVWGVTTVQIRSIRSVLREHPEVVPIEDHLWPNNGWPTLPLLGYLPPDLRDELKAPRRFGIYLDTTDGEYFGAGNMLSSYPDPHWRAAVDSVERGAHVVLVRLNVLDRTSRGTLFGLNGIMPTAVARALWAPRPSLDEVWRDWAADLFGREAAPHVVAALKETATVLTKGFSYRGMYLLEHSTISQHRWRPTTSWRGDARTPLIGPPTGRPLYDADAGSVPAQESIGWQIRPTSGRIADFEQNQAEARAAVERATAALQAAKPHLSDSDYEHLHEACVNTQWMLKAVHQLGLLAHAANVVMTADRRDPQQLQAWAKEIGNLQGLAARIEQEFGDDYLTTHDFIRVTLDGQKRHGPSLAMCLRAVAQTHQRTLNDIQSK
jgi:hypothetical protein